MARCPHHGNYENDLPCCPKCSPRGAEPSDADEKQESRAAEVPPLSHHPADSSTASRQVRDASPEQAVKPSFILSNFSDIHSRGQQPLDLDLIDLPIDSHIEEVKLTFDENNFSATANLRKRETISKGIRLPVRLLPALGLPCGVYDLDISVHLKSKLGELQLFEGTARIPVLDLEQIKLMQGPAVQHHIAVNYALHSGDANADAFRGANISPQFGVENPKAAAHSTKSFSGRLVERTFVPSANCIAACIALAETAPYRYVRLFALKDTVLGRVMRAPDEPEADILLDTPAGPKQEKMLGYLSRQHAVIRWNGYRFDLDTLGKWGIAIDADRLGKGSPPKMLKLGQVLRIPGVFPEGCVALKVLAATSHTLILANGDTGGLLVIVAPETRPAAVLFDWNPTLPLFFHHQGSFWLLDPKSRNERRLEGQQVDLGPAGKGILSGQPYPELNLLNHAPGEYADREDVGA